MVKKSEEPLNLYSEELKGHIIDILTVKGALSFRQLRGEVLQSYSVGALMPCLVEMRDEGRIAWNRDGFLVYERSEESKAEEGAPSVRS